MGSKVESRHMAGWLTALIGGTLACAAPTGARTVTQVVKAEGATTDTFAGLVAARFGADVTVQAISGRGIVRNYDGFAAPTVPQAWPFALFDGQVPATDDGWSQQVIAIALGTNDLSTPLRNGEPWQDRAALQADYRATYGNFLRTLRQRHPGAYLLVWATDIAGGEVAAQAQAVVTAMQADGEQRIGFVPVTGLTFAACHHHPDLADDAAIAAAIAAHVDQHPDICPPRPSEA